MSIKNQHALVTGASRNIGAAIAVRLAIAGCHVSMVAQQHAEGLAQTAKAAQAHGVNTHTVLADLATAQGCDRAISEAKQSLGVIDILIHTVAIRPHQPFTSLKFSDWENVRSVILDSTMRLTMGVIPDMLAQERGRMVLFTGLGAYKGSAERAHVSAAKMGITGLARGLASEYAENNIRVNVISPGVIDTERANPQWYANSPITARKNPMGRLGTVEEVANTAKFLVSDDSGFITGQTIHVNGGEFYHG